MKKILLLLIAILSLHISAEAQGFEIRDGQFLLNGKPMRIYGGEMHYARIPREYWQQRIQMAKAMGCNALSIYVMWNYHETAPGVWDWHSDNHDLRAFVELARAEGMYIILRPGPYVCAEWDFGGFPYWMADMKLRSNDPAFLDSCRTYLKQVFQQVDGLFAEQGGNILMTQVENEYGSFSFDMQFRLSHQNRKKYLENLAAIYREVGFTHTLFTCDGGIIPIINFARLGHIQGIFPGTNDSKFLATAHHTVRKYFNRKGPYYIPEEYAGWFTHWGDAHVFHRDVESYKTHIESLLKTDFSFSYYMIHGGTNFGFWNGANTNPKHEVWPVVTSYDYGAPIDEAGNATPLYDSLRAVYQRVTHTVLPPVPAPIPSMAIDSIRLDNAIPLLTTLMTPVFYTKEVLPMEKPPIILLDTYGNEKVNELWHASNLGFGNGFAVYRKDYKEAMHGKLSTDGITDYALIFVNDSLVGTINRFLPKSATPQYFEVNIPKNSTLEILVENMGRINFGKKLLDDKRGITKGIKIDGKLIDGCVNYPMLDIPYQIRGKTTYKPNQPVFYIARFTLSHTADTYLDMHGFGKGVVFVNGHNLGRYWEIGPQYSLYVPGVWLNKGMNEIVIFDEINHSQQHYIHATAKPVNR